MRQARGFGQVFIVDLERRRDAGVQHDQLVAQHFDLAAFQIGVGRAVRASPHQAFDLHAELVAHVFGDGEHLGAIRVADDLHIAFAVAQVDKNHTAMIAAAIDPAAQAHGLAQQAFGHQTAVVGAHGSDLCFSDSHKNTR